MKKVSLGSVPWYIYISGIVTVVLLTLLLTGWSDAYDNANKALRRGNSQYASAAYEDALVEYETGIMKQTENGAPNSDAVLSTNAAHDSGDMQNPTAVQSLTAALNFNAAQTAYLVGDYEKAAKYYENSEDCLDKYLNLGNIFFKASNATEDVNQKMQCYSKALQFYKEGIIKFPSNVPLKYNYETVKAMLDDIQEQTEQDSKDENGEQNESESKDKSGEQNESESKNESGEQNESESKNESGNQDESEGENQESQSQEGQESQNQDQESEAGENQQSQQDKTSGQDENAGSAQDEGQASDEQQSAYSTDDGEYDQNQEAIERVLAILESQEQASLKNNQEVVGRKGDGRDW